jgi:hypothetical protein
LFLFSFIAVGFSQLSRFDVVQWASAPFVSIPHVIYQRNSYRCLINGAEAPDSPYYPFNSQLKLTAMNSPSFECQPLIRINNKNQNPEQIARDRIDEVCLTERHFLASR